LALKVESLALRVKSLLTSLAIPKSYLGLIFIFVLVFVSRDFEVGSK